MNQKELIMKNLDLTSEEADELLKDDKAIDRGERMPFDLTKEQQAIAQSFTKAGTKTKKAPTVYKFEKKKVENAPKAEIIKAVADLLEKLEMLDIKIENAERLISFSNGENNFELTLTQKRKPKT